jgi:ribosomal protein L7/L12
MARIGGATEVVMDDATLRKRLAAIEEQLDRLSVQAGVSYDRRGAGIPQNVRDLVDANKRIDAIKELMRQTGMSLIEAKDTPRTTSATHARG